MLSNYFLRYPIWFLLILFLISRSALTQPDDIKFERITVNEGLPISVIYSMFKDSRGFVWFGTAVGLARYDGYDFKEYNTSHDKPGSISGNLVFNYLEDNEGFLWFGTTNGLNRMNKDNKTFTSFLNDPNDPSSISDNQITFIIEDKENMIWVGTRRGGLSKYNRNTGKFTVYKNIPGDTNSLTNNWAEIGFIDKEGYLWIGTANSEGIGYLNKFDKEKNNFIHYIIPFTEYPIGGVVSSIYEDKNNNLWIGTTEGLAKLIPESNINEFRKIYIIKRFFNHPPRYINGIVEDDDGNLWISCADGLIIFNPQTERYKELKNDPDDNYSIISNHQMGIYQDNDKIIWLYSGEGICYYNKNKWKINHFSDTWVTSICGDNSGNLYLGKYTGLFRYDQKNNISEKILYNKKLPDSWQHNTIYTVNADIPGILLAGMGPFFFKYDLNSGTYTDYSTFPDLFLPRTIYVDRYDMIWIGMSDNGIKIFNKEMAEIASLKNIEGDTSSLCKGLINSIYEDKDSVIWIGTTSGLEKVNTNRIKNDNKNSISFSITHYKSKFGDTATLSNDFIGQLYEDDNENLWIATLGGGLNKLNKTNNTFKYYTVEEGLPDNRISGILPDDRGNFWISTFHGLSKFNPSTGQCKNYNQNDGLQSDEFVFGSCFKSGTGELFFGQTNGFISFFPDSIKDNTKIPPVFITSFKVYNKEAELVKSILVTDEIVLSYADNFFSFEFSALDYTNSMKNEYMYMLEGIDKDWVKTPASKREASYTDIDPGDYIFRVKGSNNDGLWNEKGTSIKVIITPPWWQTWWFRSCGIILIIGFMGYIRQRKISKIKKEMHIQAEFTKQLIESQEKERKRIAGELHDSLGQNLLIIKNKALMGKKNPGKNQELIEDISELSSSTLEEVREISYNLHPYQLESLGLTRAIESITEKAESSTGIKFENDLDLIDSILSPEAEINVYRIIQECVNNIIKHSNASRVKLKIKREIEKLFVTISDNGKGYDVSAALSGRTKMSLGLMDITERAKLLGGKVTFESITGKGSRCSMTLTIKK